MNPNTIKSALMAVMLAGVLALAGCGGGSDDAPTGPTDAEKAAMEAMEAAATAVAAANMAALALDNTSDEAAVQAVADLIAAAETAIAALPAADQAAQTANLAASKAVVDAQNARLAAEAARQAAQDELDQAAQEEADRMAAEAAEEARKAAEAMAATAAKLYAGISAPMGDPASPGLNDRAARYDTTDGSTVEVFIGDGATNAAAVPLSEDEDAVVTALHGWAGKRFTAEPDGDSGTYEAMVYSNVGEPTPGKKFGSAEAVPNDDYEYQLTNGAISVDTTDTTNHPTSRVGLPGVTRTAGTETFNLPDPNPGGATTLINVPGSYRGVPGTYTCNPTTPADGCTASVAASGFTLAGGTWTFTPTNADTQLMEVPNNVYASYGWWLHKSEDESEFTASAFAANRGAVAGATGITALAGTATYSGGAAGKYALQSATGGTNDAGHFTADATLEANFSDDTVAGTIDNFVGADGQSRMWSVELMTSVVSDTGAIAGSVMQRTDSATLTNQMTQWTIDGTAADAAGEWRGTLYSNAADGVPQIATGTFYSEYGTDGKMVGAFGANN